MITNPPDTSIAHNLTERIILKYADTVRNLYATKLDGSPKSPHRQKISRYPHARKKIYHQQIAVFIAVVGRSWSQVQLTKGR